jgi:potassium-transporting ATPase KdpC subunit
MVRRQLLTGLLMTVALTVLLGLIFPLVVTGVSQVAFKDDANGSLVKDKAGTVVGSSLIGQSFLDADGNPIAKYFQPRPSAAGAGYDPKASGASNLGPSNQTLLDDVSQRVAAYRELNGLSADQYVPVDAVTASGSGLDPGITVANARLQAPRVAQARGLSEDVVLQAIDAHTQDKQWGFLGERWVNVVTLNLALDASS